jgi:hypothetical protein
MCALSRQVDLIDRSDYRFSNSDIWISRDEELAQSFAAMNGSVR